MFCADFQVESVCKHFKKRFFIPCSSVVFLDIYPIGFQSQMFWELLSPVQDLGAGMTDMALNPLLLRLKIHIFVILPNCGFLRWCGFVLDEIISLPFLLISKLSIYPLLWRLCSSSFQVPYHGIYSICSCRFVVSLGGGGEFRIFPYCCFEPSLLFV